MGLVTLDGKAECRSVHIEEHVVLCLLAVGFPHLTFTRKMVESYLFDQTYHVYAWRCERTDSYTGLAIVQQHEDCYELAYFMVVPWEQGTYTARAFMSALLGRVGQLTPRRDVMTLLCRVSNMRALCFYLKNGFTVLSYKPDVFEIDGEDGVQMRHILRQWG